ncbi:MAG: hypothetical protein M3Y50_03920 [Acidobacteriota bacterium]|nr:hypothetical protein [Acidobacteriota bacterium]
MKTQQVAIATRILIYAGSLWAILLAVALVLHSRAGLIAFGVVLLLISVAALLMACAWTLRKLWVWSGIAASAIATRHPGRSRSSLPAASESEVRA